MKRSSWIGLVLLGIVIAFLLHLLDLTRAKQPDQTIVATQIVAVTNTAEPFQNPSTPAACLMVIRGNKILFDPAKLELGDMAMQISNITGHYKETGDPYRYLNISCVGGKPKVAAGSADLNCREDSIQWDDNGGWKCVTLNGQFENQQGTPMWPAGEPTP